jgi:hypothetical protein
MMVGAALALLAGGCMAVPAGPVAVESDAISYETGPCFGACPVFKVTVRPDGTGTFEGRRFTSVTGERSFRLTGAQYRAFADQLAPLRPREGSVRLSGDQCRQTATDMPSAEVTWFSQIGNSQSYYFYFGCDMEKNRAIAERLRRAPSLLPIRDLIGREL